MVWSILPSTTQTGSYTSSKHCAEVKWKTFLTNQRKFEYPFDPFEQSASSTRIKPRVIEWEESMHLANMATRFNKAYGVTCRRDVQTFEIQVAAYGSRHRPLLESKDKQWVSDNCWTRWRYIMRTWLSDSLDTTLHKRRKMLHKIPVTRLVEESIRVPVDKREEPTRCKQDKILTGH